MTEFTAGFIAGLFTMFAVLLALSFAFGEWKTVRDAGEQYDPEAR